MQNSLVRPCSWYWGVGVFTGVLIAAEVSGAHINLAVTLALVFAGKFSASLMLLYISAQMLVAMFGSGLVWLSLMWDWVP